MERGKGGGGREERGEEGGGRRERRILSIDNHLLLSITIMRIVYVY